MEVDDLFPVAETLQMLRFAEAGRRRHPPHRPGCRFAEADVDERKRIFGDHLLAYVPLAGLIRRVLDERPSHRAPLRFSEQLADFLPDQTADETIRTVINWGRYAEIFAYDEASNQFSLENPS